MLVVIRSSILVTTLILIGLYIFNIGTFFTIGEESKTEEDRLESMSTLGNENFVVRFFVV